MGKSRSDDTADAHIAVIGDRQNLTALILPQMVIPFFDTQEAA